MTTFSDPAVQALRTAYAQQIAVVRASARLLGIPPNLLDEVALQAFVMAHSRGEDLSAVEPARARMTALTRRVAEWFREELPPGAGDAPLAVSGGSALTHFLAGLSEPAREIFVLSEVGGLKVPEISAELGISFDTARGVVVEVVREFATAAARGGAEEVLHDLVEAMKPTPAELEQQLAALMTRVMPQGAAPPAPPPPPEPEPPHAQWVVPSILRGTGLVDEPAPTELSRPTVITGGPDGRLPPRPPMAQGTGSPGQVAGGGVLGALGLPGPPAPSGGGGVLGALGGLPPPPVRPPVQGPPAGAMTQGTGPVGQVPPIAPPPAVGPRGQVGLPPVIGAPPVVGAPVMGPPLMARPQVAPPVAPPMAVAPVAPPFAPPMAGAPVAPPMAAGPPMAPPIAGSWGQVSGSVAPGTGPSGQAAPSVGVAPGTGPWGQVPPGAPVQAPVPVAPAAPMAPQVPMGGVQMPAAPAAPMPPAAPMAPFAPMPSEPMAPMPMAPVPSGPAVPSAPWGQAGVPGVPVGPVQVAPGTGPARQTGPRSIVADLDVPERDLDERPKRLVSRPFALIVVSLLVLGVAGGGGFLAWQHFQPQPEPEPPVEAAPEPAPAPEPPPPPEEPAPPLGPELPPTQVTPPPSTPTPTKKPAKGEEKTNPKGESAGGGGGTKTGGGTRPSGGGGGGGGTSKPPPEEPTPKRGGSTGGKPDANDPGRVLVELEYLSAIDKALKANNWAQALAYVEQHDRELPGGQLIDKFDERRIKALCGMGRGAEAKTKVDQILAKRPTSKVKAALAESCK